MSTKKFSFHHHFTKTQLAAEELIIVFVLCVVLAVSSWAAEAILPIRATIVRCVTPDERVKMCHERQLCCHLIEERQDSE